MIGGTLNIIPIIMVQVIPVVYVKRFIKVYLIVLIVPVYPITVICLLKGIVSPLFWYIAIPVYLYAVFPHKRIIGWSVGCLCMMLFAFGLALVLRHVLYHDAPISYGPMPLIDALLTEMINAFFAFSLLCHSLYYIHRFQQIRIPLQMDPVCVADEGDSLLDFENNEDYKYEKIYGQIVEYFQTKQPHLDSNFKLTQLAYDMNINIAYLTKTIRQQTDMNFNNFVNSYRIEHAKQLIQANSQKYTMKYIYISSGFKNQSTFNSAFKQKEGITPSEYYKKLAEMK
ncbi:MAG: AraC family transcriptional regulator [Prevotella sp.]|nr:AraC family transcriptional regulator [Prevotella sp.]